MTTDRAGTADFAHTPEPPGQRTTEPGRTPESEHTPEPGRKPEAERKPEPARKPEAERAPDGTRPRFPALLIPVWCATRALLLLTVFRVLVVPGPDVTSDVKGIYRSWYGVLSQGTFPRHDVTWQYPPAAALPVLSPRLLPFLDYASAFFLLAWAADLAVTVLLLWAGRGRGRTWHGAWVWTAGVFLLGPTVYARYDLMVTAVAVAALLAGVRHPRLMGVLTGLGAMLKAWPALLLLGARRVSTWVAAVLATGALALGFWLTMPGAFDFLTAQRDRGTEVESLSALALHIARQFGWHGWVQYNYGSMEFLGPHVVAVSRAALGLSALAFVWLLLWRVRARRFEPHTYADAAFTAVLLFTLTSRVLSPQYLVWLAGLAAVCLTFAASRMGVAAWLVVIACAVTLVEFPVRFLDVVTSTPLGLSLLLLRNGLLVIAAAFAMVDLWRATVPGPRLSPVPVPDTPASAA